MLFRCIENSVLFMVFRCFFDIPSKYIEMHFFNILSKYHWNSIEQHRIFNSISMVCQKNAFRWYFNALSIVRQKRIKILMHFRWYVKKIYFDALSMVWRKNIEIPSNNIEFSIHRKSIKFTLKFRWLIGQSLENFQNQPKFLIFKLLNAFLTSKTYKHKINNFRAYLFH